MTFDSNPKRQPHIPSTTGPPCPILKNGRAYVPEPLMEDEKTFIWYSQVLIPYYFAGNVHAFIGHLHIPSKKPLKVGSFFHSHVPSKLVVFEDNLFDLSFMNNLVF